MSDAPTVFDLQELSDRAGVTPRTVRYYIHQGLLRSPGPPGPGAKYDAGYVDRLRLIRRLQREHLPLAEIRRRLETLDDGAVRDLLHLPPDRSSAVDYVRSVIRSPSLHATAFGAAAPIASSGAPRTPAPTERSQWDRITLARDLELHVRRPLSREQNRMVEKLLEYARRLLEEDTP